MHIVVQQNDYLYCALYCVNYSVKFLLGVPGCRFSYRLVVRSRIGESFPYLSTAFSIYTWMACRSLTSTADETTIAFPGATPHEQAS